MALESIDNAPGAGTGVGVLLSGNIAGLLSWRWAFWALAVALLLVAALIRLPPEPARGGAGRLADRLLRGGLTDARVRIAAVSYAAAARLALPPFLGAWPLWATMPLFVLGTTALCCGNPPLDAARLDVVPAGLWGRAEGIRTALRSLSVAAAPLLFGLIAELASGSRAEGLRLAFVLMLLPLGASGWILWRALGSYGADTATALAADGEGG